LGTITTGSTPDNDIIPLRLLLLPFLGRLCQHHE